ncbi:MAG: UPF0175 family protein, partial [Acidobacteriaceae bacterium]|nr:UPF0175 family protein [Acidobacteriaceae bacterium]
MTVTIEIPDSVAIAFAPRGDVPRAVLEAMALEGYREQRLTESQIRRMLGFETRMEVHGFLKEHGVSMHYTMDDLQRDTAAALKVARSVELERK